MRHPSRLLPLVFLCVCVISLASCRKRDSSYRIPEFPPTSMFDSIIDMTPAYAQVFKVRYLSDGTPLVDIAIPHMKGETATDTFRLALVRQSSTAPIPEGYRQLAVPIRSVVCTDSRQISFFLALDSLALVKGVPEIWEQHSPRVSGMMRDGRILQTGTESKPDIPAIERLAPDVVLASPLLYLNNQFRDSRQTVIPIFSAWESNPLAQAEWIKFIALLIGKEAFGSDYFGKTEQNYNEAKVSMLDITSRPPVRLGVKECELYYLLQSDSTTNQSNGKWHYLENEHFEDLFITDAGGKVPQRMTKPFPTHIAYDYGIIRFEETATVAPDTILKDLISILHPEVIPKDSIWNRRYFK